MKNSKQQQEQQQQLRDPMSTPTTTTNTPVKSDHTKSDIKNDDGDAALSSLFQLIQSNLQSMDSDDSDSSGKLPKNTFMYKLSNNKRYVLDMAQRSLRRLDNGDSSSDSSSDDDQMAHVVIEMRDEDFMDMMHGKVQPTQLFFAKKLRIRGNLQLAMRMMTLRERLTRPASSPSPSIQSKLWMKFQLSTQIK